MKNVTMTPSAFRAVLHLLGCGGKHLLPCLSGAEDFIAGREVLCQNGWAELDFDGSLLPRSDFSRLIYDFSHAEAALQLELTESTCWMLRAPTEMLYIEQKGETVRLERRKGRDFLPWVREVLMLASAGTLTTAHAEASHTSELSDTEKESRPRAEVLAKHLALFFAKALSV